MKIKAIVFDKTNSVVLRDIEMRECGDDEILAETIYSFVSPGTELRVLTGGQPNVNFPLIPGYSWVGKVKEVGRNVKGWEAGELVSGRNPIPVESIGSCWGGQASHHLCEPDSTVVKLPPGADPWNYVHAEVASISFRGITAASPAQNETAVIIGQGLIGLFNTKWLLLRGVRVIAADIHDIRLEPARKWGVTAALNADSPDIKEKIMSYCDGGADIVIEASASLEGVRLAGSLLKKPVFQLLRKPFNTNYNPSRDLPRLVFQATYHTLSIESKPAGILPPIEGAVVLQPSDRTVGDRIQVIEHIRRGDLKISDIIDSPVPVNEAPGSYMELLKHPDRIRGLAFDWK